MRGARLTREGHMSVVTRLAPQPDEPSAPLIRSQLDAILASDLFVRSERLSQFLRFIVDRTLAGEGDTLKEQVIAVELYGKGADFNTAADPIVRVDARRLRDRLREYYASAPEDPVRISVPKGSYTPVFEATGNGAVGNLPLPAATDEHAGRTMTNAAAAAPRVWGRWIAALAGVLLAATVWIALRRGSAEGTPAPRLLTVTAFPGAEGMPAFSPDGNFVVFTWTGPSATAPNDIWVKAVEGDGLRRLTETPDGHEAWPAWSPDGRQIVFTRMVSGIPSVFLISALGGPERTVAERAAQATWLPDGRSLVMGRRDADGRFVLVHHDLETGAERRLVEAPPGYMHGHPRISPDGRRLAFTWTSPDLTRAALFVIPTSGGEPTQLTEWGGTLGGLTWTPDGREIIFPQSDLGGMRLFRLGAERDARATPMTDVPPGVNWASASGARDRATFRLALGHGQPDVGLRLIDLQAAGDGDHRAATTAFSDATRMDAPGRFSRDGTRVAFVSDRSGHQQVWVARRDGSDLRSVTRFENATINVGSWSPDGRWLAFDATVDGNADVYVVRVDGGTSTRLTRSSSAEIDPEWSRDGSWIYYASMASGRSEIWKMRSNGTEPVQLTSEGGFDPRESPDGADVYFVDHPRWSGPGLPATLKRVSARGGPAFVVRSDVVPGAWDVADAGIVSVDASVGPITTSQAVDRVRLHPFAGGPAQLVRDLAFPVARWGSSRTLAVSDDGRWALISHIDRWDRDILVIDGFR